MQNIPVSSPSLISVLRWEPPDHAKIIVGELRGRTDILNVVPLLEIATDDAAQNWLRRDATELAAIHGTERAVAWLRDFVCDGKQPTVRRMLAIDALAALQLPDKTLDIIEDIARQPGNTELRASAINQLARFRNLRSISTLVALLPDRDAGVRAAADAAISKIFESYGGRVKATQLMVERAENEYRRGNYQLARRVSDTVLHLDPLNSRGLYIRARLQPTHSHVH